MEQLHTPGEIIELSNLAHITEGLVLLAIGVLVIAQGMGYLRKSWQRYLIPSIALTASLVLIGFLFFDHLNELPLAWQWVTTDMQQKQHLQMGVVLGIGSIISLVGVRLKQEKFNLALYAAIAVIGFLFIIHPQHGNDAQATAALLIHRIAGSTLIVASLAQMAALFTQRWRKLLMVLAGISLGISAMLFMIYREPPMSPDMINESQNSSEPINTNMEHMEH